MKKRYTIPVGIIRKLDALQNAVHYRRVALAPKPDTKLGALSAALVGDGAEPRPLEMLEARIERMATELVALGYTHQVNLVRQNAHRSSHEFGPGEWAAYVEELYGTRPAKPKARNVGSDEYPQVRKLLQNI